MKFRLTLLALVAAVLCAAAVAHAGTQDFTLVNKTGVIINEMYISASATNDWEEDILGVDTLADGASAEITFSPTEQAEAWDLKVVDSQGDAIVWTGLNLNAISKVTLHFADGKPTADLE